MQLDTPTSTFETVDAETIGEAIFELQNAEEGYAVLEVGDDEEGQNGHFLQALGRNGDEYALQYRGGLDAPLLRAEAPSTLGPRRLARIFYDFSQTLERPDSVGWTPVTAAGWEDLFFIADAHLDDESADAAVEALREFVDTRDWKLDPVQVVDVRVDPDQDPEATPALGLKYPMGKLEPRTGPTTEDIRRIIEFLGDLAAETGLVFVIGGMNPDAGAFEEWMTVETADPPTRQMLIDLGENYDSTGRIRFI